MAGTAGGTGAPANGGIFSLWSAVNAAALPNGIDDDDSINL